MLGKRNRRPHARLVPAVLACALLAGGSATAASADTTPTLGQATGRLAQLEQQITAAQAELARQQSALHRALTSLSTDQTAYQGVQSKLMSFRARLSDAQAQYDQYRTAIDERAAQAYMQGPFAAVDALLTSGSVSELGDRLQFESAIAQHDGSLAAQADTSRAELQRAVDAQQKLLDQRSALVRRSATHQQQLALTFGAEQAALKQLASARKEALRLVNSLQAKLHLQAVIARGGGMPITYGQWAAKFLSALGAPVSRRNLVVMVAWESAEGTDASWNPLATTYDIAGATMFNSVGVKNYPSLAVGIQATIGTLQGTSHGYEHIVAGLMASKDPMVTGGAINASDWCYGCSGGQYVIELIPVVEKYYSKYANR
jgi:peptidoglycan hydrolase CwlO-like protein